ncbi:VOC family protein [Halegenticoccus soli]|uniref:VOC family protein n=1 Tax=Halegenticoccus soli TaxID=1985678 RepID=UPI000C6EC675|nr:VOC family protein [Halegenticoccus soli]
MKANTYLNFAGNTEEAFRFYADALGVELTDIVRFEDMPTEGESIPEHEQEKVMHVGLPLDGDQTLMGSDILESQEHELVVGNNTYISLHVDSKEEADRLFAALSEGGEAEMEMADMPWGDYWGSFSDRFGVQWMISYTYSGQ